MSKFILTDECFKCRGGLQSAAPVPLERLFCAKNDVAAFQILCDNGGKRCILNSGDSPALTYETDLTRYRIEVVGNFSETVYCEGYVKDESGVPCADILYECPLTYDGGIYAPAFVCLEIPEDALAGEYLTEINIYRSCGAHEETQETSMRLLLIVYDFVMPSPRDFRCHLDLWQHNSNVARTYGVELWSDAHFRQMEKIVASLADLGQKSVTVVAGDCPWRGWGCYLLKDHPATLFEYSMARVRKTKSGEYAFDFSVLRRYIELCFTYGISEDITVYGLMGIWTNMPLFNGDAPDDHPEKVLVRYLDEADGCYKYMKKSEDIVNYIRALFSFFRETNVFEKVRIGADEPSDCAAYEKNYLLLKGLAPDVRFKMALDKTAAIEKFGERVSDIAASFPCSCGKGDLLRSLKEKGKRVLWYVCNVPDKPNSVLHSELIELRALGHIGFLFDFDGFLRWAYTCWTEKPLEDVRYNNTALPAGDVNLIYPSKDGNLLFSLRYFALKKALQDYELYRMLCDKGKKEHAERAMRTVLKNTDAKTYMKDEFHTVDGIYSKDYADYAAFRKFAFEILEKE